MRVQEAWLRQRMAHEHLCKAYTYLTRSDPREADIVKWTNFTAAYYETYDKPFSRNSFSRPEPYSLVKPDASPALALHLQGLLPGDFLMRQQNHAWSHSAWTRTTAGHGVLIANMYGMPQVCFPFLRLSDEVASSRFSKGISQK